MAICTKLSLWLERSGYGGSGAPRGWDPGGSGGLDVLIPTPTPMPDFVPEDESISANARHCPSG